jgi:hypothetical protein
MNIYWYIGVHEALEPACMIDMQMAHYDGLHVPDIVSSCLDGDIEVVLLFVFYTGKDIYKWSAPMLVPLSVTERIKSSVSRHTTSRSLAHPVSKRMSPAWGCSIRTAIAMRLRRLREPSGLLSVVVLAPLMRLALSVKRFRHEGVDLYNERTLTILRLLAVCPGSAYASLSPRDTDTPGRGHGQQGELSSGSFSDRRK